MTRSFKLLIIDDSAEILAGLSNYLSIKKYDVATAKDGLEGLKLFESEKTGFDLVITDIVMPTISGVGVISSHCHHRHG
jgi:YesN/AraC family two-component response regulator